MAKQPLTIEETRRALGVSDSSVRRMLRAVLLKEAGRQAGGGILVDAQSVEAAAQLGPAVARPIEEWLAIEQCREKVEEPQHGGNNTGVAGRFLILRQRLEDDEDRPRVVDDAPLVTRIAHWAKPPIGALPLEDSIDPAPRFGNQLLIASKNASGMKPSSQ